jgi:hypothetical protein
MEMNALAIQPAHEQPAPGDLHAHIAGDKLFLPEEFARAVLKDGVRTAEDLLAYMQAFPSAVAETLHWPVQDVIRATERLRVILRGRIDDQFLRPSTRQSPPLGAMDPDDLP